MPDFSHTLRTMPGVFGPPGLSPTTGVPPASRTERMTALTISGCVVTACSGEAFESRLTLSSTFCPGDTNAAIPPSGERAASRDAATL